MSPRNKGGPNREETNHHAAGCAGTRFVLNGGSDGWFFSVRPATNRRENPNRSAGEKGSLFFGHDKNVHGLSHALQESHAMYLPVFRRGPGFEVSDRLAGASQPGESSHAEMLFQLTVGAVISS